MSDRIHQLEAENTSLKNLLRAAGMLPPSCEMPDEHETNKLIALVMDAWPLLQPSAEETDFRRQWLNAMLYVAFVYRTEKLNNKISLALWSDQANAWLRGFNVRGGTSIKAIVAAAVCSNIKYTSLHRFPCDVELSIGTSTVARPTCGWRSVLLTGLPVPTASEQRTMRPQHATFRDRADVQPWAEIER